MAKGSEIIVSADPKGKFSECIISGTPKPGTIMAKKTTDTVGGRFTYEPAGTTAASGSRGMSADGDRIPIAVLLPDHLQGKLATDAYADGDRGFLYFPTPGEDLNVLKMDVAGTGDDLAIGDKLIVDDGTGKVLLSAGSPESEPFECNETVTDPTADQLIWVTYTGN